MSETPKLEETKLISVLSAIVNSAEQQNLQDGDHKVISAIGKATINNIEYEAQIILEPRKSEHVGHYPELVIIKRYNDSEGIEIQNKEPKIE